MGNIHVKLYEIWSSGLGDVSYRYFLSGALVGLSVQWSRTICAFLAEGFLTNNSVKLF